MSIRQISYLTLDNAGSWVDYILLSSFTTYALRVATVLPIAFHSGWHFSVPVFSRVVSKYISVSSGIATGVPYIKYDVVCLEVVEELPYAASLSR